jgi:hypothetical protein
MYIVYSCIWSVTLAKSIVPRKTWRKLWHSYISKLFLTKMQMYIPCEASSWTLLHQNRKLSSRISLQIQLFCLCRLPAVILQFCNLWNLNFEYNFGYENYLSIIKNFEQRRMLSKNQSSHEKHDENCDTLTFLSCSWQRCKLNFHYFFIMGV